MKKLIARRLVWTVLIMWAVATLLFFGMRALPSGPVEAMLGAQATQESVATFRAQLGLDRPIHVQYVDWLTDIAVLDFGTSYVSNENINSLILRAAPKTASIAVVAILTGLVVAIPTGIMSATRRGTAVDHVATVAAFLGLSLPSFFIAIVLLLIFAVRLGLFPTYGYVSVTEDPVAWSKSVLLPGIAVGLPYAAVTMRMLRSSLLEVLNQPYIKTARAKGLDPRVQLFKHAMQNALIPVVTVVGLQMGLVIVSGAVAVEIIFGIRGIGRLLIGSILERDYQTTQAIILCVAGFMSLVILSMDIVYRLVDPRIKQT